jgi:hypothetical protein
MQKTHKFNKSMLINEGLRPMDLAEMVYPIFEVDTFRSKMGEDRDVCVISFQVKDRSPARDLMEFVEKGYNFVLDSDVSAGENADGEYSVFIELPRSSDLAEHINELTYGIRKLTGINDFKFKYFKQSKVHEVTEDTLKNVIPLSPRDYDAAVTRVRVEGIKKFFNKTLMDDLTIDNDIITIHKPYNNKLQLRIVKEDHVESILENIEGSIEMDEKAMSEIFWLTKVLGDYNINKIGEHFVFNNANQAMLLQRI